MADLVGRTGVILRRWLAAGLLLWALPLYADEAKRLRPGVFLYAAPGLADPRFAESVVLLVEHAEGGSVGLVINRPTRVPVQELLPELGELPPPGVVLHWGGPVQPQAILALLRSPVAPTGTRRVVPGVHLCTDLEELKKAARRPEAAGGVRIYTGYAGWTAGQLAAEMREGAWVIGPADAGAVFSTDPSFLWHRVHQLIRRRLEVRGRPPKEIPSSPSLRSTSGPPRPAASRLPRR